MSPCPWFVAILLLELASESNVPRRRSDINAKSSRGDFPSLRDDIPDTHILSSESDGDGGGLSSGDESSFETYVLSKSATAKQRNTSERTSKDLRRLSRGGRES